MVGPICLFPVVPKSVRVLRVLLSGRWILRNQGYSISEGSGSEEVLTSLIWAELLLFVSFDLIEHIEQLLTALQQLAHSVPLEILLLRALSDPQSLQASQWSATAPCTFSMRLPAQ